MNAQIKNGMPRIYFTGVGGQGTLTATRLLAQAAMLANCQLVAGEVHGMAQRGGVVESTLLLGGWLSPRIDLGEADIILGFEPLETLRALPYLAEGGVVFSATEPIPPLSVNLGQAEYPPEERIRGEVGQCSEQAFFMPCRELGEQAGARAAGNTALLGALCSSGLVPVELTDLFKAIEIALPTKLHAINIEAARLGHDYYRSACSATN